MYYFNTAMTGQNLPFGKFKELWDSQIKCHEIHMKLGFC